MSTRPLLASLAIVVGTVSVAFALAAVIDRWVDAGALMQAAAATVAIAVLFVLRPLEGLVAFGIAMLLAGTVEHWAGMDLRFTDELAIPLLAIVAITVHRGRLDVPRMGYRELALAIVLLAAVTSSLVNGVPVDIWVPGIGLLVKGFAFFYLVTSLRVDEDALRRTIASVFVIGLVIAVIGLVQFIRPDLVNDVLRLPPSGRQRGAIDVVGSVFTHPAIYGWLTAFLSLFLYARFAVLRARWAVLLALVLNGGTILSGRRTPVIGVLAGLIVGAAHQAAAGRAVGRRWAVVAGAIVVVVVVSIPILGDYYGTTLDRYGADRAVLAEVFATDPDPAVVSELQPRVALYAGSAAVARDHVPLGAGVGRFGSHMSREVYSPVYEDYGLHRTYGLRERNPAAVTDTFWPMILGETGIIGFLALLTFFGALATHLWRAAGITGPPGVRAFTLGALLVFIEGLVRSLTSAVFVAPPIAYFIFGAAGLALAIERHVRQAPTAPGLGSAERPNSARAAAAPRC